MQENWNLSSSLPAEPKISLRKCMFNVTLRLRLPFVLLLKFGTFSSQLRNAVLNSISSIRWTSNRVSQTTIFLAVYVDMLC
jgi:hypothetical protein